MIIRQAKKQDLKQIIDIEHICFPEAEAASTQEFHERFLAFPENFLVAEKNHNIVGFINGATTNHPVLPDELYHNIHLHDPQGDYQTVFGLDVLPEYRHQGIAGELIKAYINLTLEKGKKGIVLTCKDHLIHYYEKFGFVHQGHSLSNHGGASWNDMLLLFEK